MIRPLTIPHSFYRIPLIFCGVLTLVLAGCRAEKEPVAMITEAPPPRVFAVESHRELDRFFADQNYTVYSLSDGVPPIIVEHIPDDLLQIEETDDKKRIFFLSLLPIVLLANDEIARQRQEVTETCTRFDQGKELSEDDLFRLEIVCADYLISGDPLRNKMVRRRLLERVDIIPPPLVLAQAATESGYGTSNFARTGNNLFGMYTFALGTGMVPRGQGKGRTFEIRRFDSVFDSVRYYMNTLNTHEAYALFRYRRAQHRAQGDDVGRLDLTDTLGAYSERGEDYIRDLRIMIRSNRLTLFSDVRLRPPPPLRPVPSLADVVGSGAD